MADTGADFDGSPGRRHPPGMSGKFRSKPEGTLLSERSAWSDDCAWFTGARSGAMVGASAGAIASCIEQMFE